MDKSLDENWFSKSNHVFAACFLDFFGLGVCRGADRKFSKFLDDEISVEKGQCLIYVKDILSLGSIGGGHS